MVRFYPAAIRGVMLCRFSARRPALDGLRCTVFADMIHLFSSLGPEKRIDGRVGCDWRVGTLGFVMHGIEGVDAGFAIGEYG